METLILHAIAAILWMLSGLIAMTFQASMDKRKRDHGLFHFFWWWLTAIIAFTLQVIA